MSYLEEELDNSWFDRAACKDIGFAIFFTEDPSAPLVNIEGTPGYYCFRCEVSVDCLEYSIENKIYDGIYGGVNETQRKKLINDRIKVRRKVRRELRNKLREEQ
jgi:WhiB family redox-sensing transcriptional regulator